METTIEIVRVDSKNTRLTITPNRVTLKLPKDTSEDEKEHLINFTRNVLDEILPVTQSWRGKFKDDVILLANDSQTKHKRFKNK